mgnify:CR=1 FL=1
MPTMTRSRRSSSACAAAPRRRTTGGPGDARESGGADGSGGVGGSNRAAEQLSPTDRSLDWQHRRGMAFADLLMRIPTDHLHSKVSATMLITTRVDDLLAGLSAHGLGLPGDHRLIHAGAAIDDAPVRGHRGAGPDHHHIADSEVCWGDSHDVLAVDRGVDLRERLECLDDRRRDERQVGEVDALAGLEVLLVARTRGGDLTRLAVEHLEPLGRLHGWRPARAVVQWSYAKDLT